MFLLLEIKLKNIILVHQFNEHLFVEGSVSRYNHPQYRRIHIGIGHKIAEIIGTSFIKTSLKTKVLSEAISRRDALVDALNKLEDSNLSEISDHFLKTFDSFGLNLKQGDDYLKTEKSNEPDQGRRKVLIGLTASFAAAGVAFAATPFVTTWNPSARAKAIGSSVKVDVSKMMVNNATEEGMGDGGKQLASGLTDKDAR